jgi:hypothetical protein
MAIMDFVKEHPDVAIGGGIVLLIAVGAYVISKQSAGVGTGTPTTSTGAPSGLKNGVVYVPTSTSFSTQNINKGTDIGNTTTNNQTRNRKIINPSPPPVPSPSPVPTCKVGYHFQSNKLGVLVPQGSYTTAGGYCVPDQTVVTPPVHKQPKPPVPPTPKPPVPPTPKPPQPSGGGSTVHPTPWPSATSTLSGIAAAHNMSLSQIEALNPWIYQQRGTWNLIYTSDNIRVS